MVLVSSILECQSNAASLPKSLLLYVNLRQLNIKFSMCTFPVY